MCDVPRPNSTLCATATEAQNGVEMTNAAIALVSGKSSTFVLGVQPPTTACSTWRSEYFGLFPDGYAVCLNCPQGTQIPQPYTDANGVCVDKCKDLINASGDIPQEGVDNFCKQYARVSTNFDKTLCFDNACSSNGTALKPPDFVDPRRNPELVKWAVGPNDGTQASGNDLKRVKLTSGDDNQNFDAGSAAAQVIAKGNAWVDFEAGGTGLSHVLGVSACKPPCSDGDPQDSDPSLADIEVGINLNKDGLVYLIENGVIMYGPFGPYAAGERFRLRISDNGSEAAIDFQRLVCTPECVPQFPSFVSAGNTVGYPLRIDTSFREKDALLKNVTVVRIRTP